MAGRPRRTLLTVMAAATLVGLLLPALLLGGWLIGVREPELAARAAQRALDERLDLLARSLPEVLWNLEATAAGEVVSAIMSSDDVVSIRVHESLQDTPFVERAMPGRALGSQRRGQRDVLRNGVKIGHVAIEIDDHLATAALRRQRLAYVGTVGAQLVLSLLLVVALLYTRVTQPLQRLGRFANAIAAGRLSEAIAPPRSEEIRVLAASLEEMRDALRQQFDAQQALLARIRGVAETVPGVLFQMHPGADEQPVFDYVSEAIRDHFPLSPQEAMAEPARWLACIHAEDRARVRDTLAAAVRRRGAWRAEFRIAGAATAAGADDERWLLGQANPTQAPDGTLAWHGLLTDISAQRRDAQELERHRHRLEERVQARTRELAAATEAAQAASRAKTTMLQNMSHELRTPMSAVIGLADLMRQDIADPVQQRRLQQIDTAAGHLMSVINDVLDLAKIEAGQLTLESVEFTVDRVFEDLVALLADEAGRKGLRLESEVAAELAMLPLLGDVRRLGAVLLNLLGNALKFTERGFVRLRAGIASSQADPPLLRIEVQDSGIGIADEVQALLFSDFMQADASASRRYGGAGLGLSLCRRLVALMGGEIGVRSRPGEGSLFWITLPLKPAPPPAPQAAAPAPASALAALKGARVLVVDDDLVNLEIAATMLEREGLVVDRASDGWQACGKAEEVDYALVFMDMQMPGMDGLETTRRIRRSARAGGVPIVALTANAYDDDRQRCLDAGMNDHVAKPLNARRLHAAVERWLDRRLVRGAPAATD